MSKHDKKHKNNSNPFADGENEEINVENTEDVPVSEQEEQDLAQPQETKEEQSEEENKGNETSEENSSSEEKKGIFDGLFKKMMMKLKS